MPNRGPAPGAREASVEWLATFEAWWHDAMEVASREPSARGAPAALYFDSGLPRPRRCCRLRSRQNLALIREKSRDLEEHG